MRNIDIKLDDLPPADIEAMKANGIYDKLQNIQRESRRGQMEFERWEAGQMKKLDTLPEDYRNAVGTHHNADRGERLAIKTLCQLPPELDFDVLVFEDAETRVFVAMEIFA